MKKISIFIASSIDQFKEERRLLESFIRRISDDYEERPGVKIIPLLCENHDSALSLGRKQEEYNEQIRGSEICVFLFFTKVGEYTCEEFEVARAHFLEFGKPKIYTYFKVVEENKLEESLTAFKTKLDRELGHFYEMFENVDTVKLRILQNLIKIIPELGFVEVKTEGGRLLVDGRANDGIDLSNVSEFANNKDLNEMKSELSAVEEEYFALKPKVVSGECSDEEYKRYCGIATKRQTLIDEIEELEKNIFNLSLRMTTDINGEEISHRQKEAYRLFTLGDYEGALAVLDKEEITGDFLRARQRIAQRAHEQDIAVCKKYIKEMSTRIEVLRAMTKYGARFAEIEEIYDQIVPVALEMGLELGVVYDYASYLNKQNRLLNKAGFYH